MPGKSDEVQDVHCGRGRCPTYLHRDRRLGQLLDGQLPRHVFFVAELLRQQEAYLVQIGVDPTLRRSLTADLESAARAADKGNNAATCSAISDYESHVTAQSGKKLSPDAAADLIANADSIRRIVPCG